MHSSTHAEYKQILILHFVLSNNELLFTSIVNKVWNIL